jgi:hypothetical protein
MLDNRPLWKRPWAISLMVLVAAGSGAWLALDRPVPDAWREQGRPSIELPAIFQPKADNRIFCAESVDTGRCACITSGGERPDIGQEECRRRARDSDTQAPARDEPSV